MTARIQGGILLLAKLLELGMLAAVLSALGGCGPDYSPNTYSSAAVQQANKVATGVVVGVRPIAIRADGTIGAAAGGAAGGVIGSQAPGGITGALGAVGGTLIGGIVGTTVEHTTGDTEAFEYIVRQANGDLLSVTQKDTAPLPIGQKVLVITGKQARIVPDYTVPSGPPAARQAEKDKPAPPGPETAVIDPVPPEAPAPVPPPLPAIPAAPLPPAIAPLPATAPQTASGPPPAVH